MKLVGCVIIFFVRVPTRNFKKMHDSNFSPFLTVFQAGFKLHMTRLRGTLVSITALSIPYKSLKINIPRGSLVKIDHPPPITGKRGPNNGHVDLDSIKYPFADRPQNMSLYSRSNGNWVENLRPRLMIHLLFHRKIL